MVPGALNVDREERVAAALHSLEMPLGKAEIRAEFIQLRARACPTCASRSASAWPSPRWPTGTASWKRRSLRAGPWSWKPCRRNSSSLRREDHDPGRAAPAAPRRTGEPGPDGGTDRAVAGIAAQVPGGIEGGGRGAVPPIGSRAGSPALAGLLSGFRGWTKMEKK